MDVLDTIPPELCVQCKAGRSLCGISPCPLLAKVHGALPTARSTMGTELWGPSPPSLFVGRHGYPNVGIGPMLAPDTPGGPGGVASGLDDPRSWVNLAIPDIVAKRSTLVRTTHTASVHASNVDRITALAQELAIASRPVDTEVHLERAPRWDLGHVTDFTAPHGPTAPVRAASLGENVPVERRMEAVTSDTDLRAGQGLWDLYDQGTDRYQLEKVLSAGMLGLRNRRRLVPTRWSITATDDVIGSRIARAIQDFPTIDRPRVHEGTLHGNRFLVLLIPRIWGFDFIETWLKGAFWARETMSKADWEDHRGRSTYASNTTGGYYAARVSILEALQRERRQASVVAVREIDDRYTTPLGVWVVREAAAKAMATKPLVFEDVPAAIRHVDRHARVPWQNHAQLLHQRLQQPSLDRWA